MRHEFRSGYEFRSAYNTSSGLAPIGSGVLEFRKMIEANELRHTRLDDVISTYAKPEKPLD